MKLKVFCDIKDAMEDADFYLYKRGNTDSLGKPLEKKSVGDNIENKIGIKVKQEFLDRVYPDFLFYLMMNIYNSGYWKSRQYGSVIMHIRTEDVKNLEM